MKNRKNSADNLSKELTESKEPNDNAVETVDRLLTTFADNQDIVSLLFQLRRQLIDQEITYQEARSSLVELESALDKVTSPANRIGIFVSSPEPGIALLFVGGTEYFSNIDSRVKLSELRPGCRVLVNEAFAVVGNLGPTSGGSVAKVSDLLDDGRIRVSQGHGSQDLVVERGFDLKNVDLGIGDEVRVDPSFKVVLERLQTSESKEYFIENTNKYSENYITFNMIELTPKSLVGIEEFNNQYFKKLDEIDEMIVGGENASTIINKFNLRKPILVMMNKDGKDINFNKVENITDTILNTVFKLDEIENISLLETDNKYFIIEFVKKEIIQQKLEDKEVKKLVLSDLKKQTKRKFISEIISKINQNNFSKLDFDKFAKNQSLNIEKINLISINDNKILKNEIVEQVYSFAEKKVVLIHDTTFSENYLVYINDIKNDNIDKNSADYEKYNKLSKNKIRNELYNTYDNYIKSKYKIDINYKVLKSVQNYFN